MVTTDRPATKVACPIRESPSRFFFVFLFFPFGGAKSFSAVCPEQLNSGTESVICLCFIFLSLHSITERVQRSNFQKMIFTEQRDKRTIKNVYLIIIKCYTYTISQRATNSFERHRSSVWGNLYMQLHVIKTDRFHRLQNDCRNSLFISWKVIDYRNQAKVTLN